MRSKIILVITFIVMLLSVCAVSADENVTADVLTNDSTETVPIDDVDVPQEVDDDSQGNSTDVPVVNETVKANSTISAKNAVGYETFSTKITVELSSDNGTLASRPVNITVNNVIYQKVTDAKGQVILNVKLSKGSYNVDFAFGGDENTSASSGTSKITIKAPLKTTLKVSNKDINYRQGLKNAVIVRLLDEKGKAVANQNVTFKVNGKSYTVKTNKNGYAEVFLSLKKGTYKVKFSFTKSAPYLSSSGSYKIKVKSPIAKGNGYWVWSSHMKSVNLKKLSKLGTKHIFLHVHSIAVYGKSSVISFAKKAHKYGMKVHLWIQICYNGGKWVRPVNKDSSIKYSFLNGKVKEAKKYAKIKGIDGIHFDYVRFGGTAHLYKNPEKAINYFIKKASVAIHKIKPNCIVSAAVMPEPSMMSYYYGQDIPTISKYVDVIVPMTYKGNYGQKSTWITKVVKTFKKQSRSAVIWAGLQTYHSDDNVKKLSYSQLMKDARAAKAGGATGSILFRVGITKYLNFKKV